MPLHRQSFDLQESDWEEKLVSQFENCIVAPYPSFLKEIKHIFGKEVSVLFHPSWNFVTEVCSLQGFLINKEVVLFFASGYFQEQDASHVRQVFQHMIADNRDCNLYRILDLSQIEPSSLSAKKEYERIDKEFWSHWVHNYYILSPSSNKIFKTCYTFHSKKTMNSTLTVSFSKALHLYLEHKQEKQNKENFSSNLPLSTLQDLSKEELINAYSKLYDQHERLQHLEEERAIRASYHTSQLADYENRLALTIDSTSYLILSVNKDYQVLVVNTACQKHFYQVYGKPIAINDNLKEYWSVTEQAHWFPKFKEALQGKALKDVHLQYIQGKPVFLEVMLNPIKSLEGTVTGVSVFCKDITEQQLTELAIKENEKSLSKAHEIAKSGSWEYNIYTQEITLSKETLVLFHMEQEQQESVVFPLKDVLSNFIYPDDVPLFMNKIIYALEHVDDPNYHDQFEYRFIRPDGKLLNLILYSRFKSNEKGIIYGVTQDITEQKEIEEQLRAQNEELSKVNNELDKFVYRVSHDLRAPLASILGLINLARGETDRKTLMKYIDLQEKSIYKLDNFIQEIIDLSRNARLDITEEPIWFKELIHEVLENQTYHLDSASIKKYIDIAQDTTFISDRNRIFVVLNNLISNAIRYANLQQVQPYMKIKIAVINNEVTITIEDNGIGIHAQHIDKVFDMFYRACDSKPGSGLGLYIVKETVNKLGGCITLHSEPGLGTTFTITLPSLKLFT